MNVEISAMPAKIHAFERAGLGRAPFRFVGCYEDRGPKVMSEQGGVTFTVGSPGQAMGSCAFCGQSIAECCVVRSADGREFTVGSSCVMKTGDAGLRRAVKAEIREKQVVRERERWQAVKARLATDETLREKLGVVPCPNGRNESALGWALWMMENTGHAGRLKVARFVSKVEGGK